MHCPQGSAGDRLPVGLTTGPPLSGTDRPLNWNVGDEGVFHLEIAMWEDSRDTGYVQRLKRPG
jgi:hypothetical protein